MSPDLPALVEIRKFQNCSDELSNSSRFRSFFTRATVHWEKSVDQLDRM